MLSQLFTTTKGIDFTICALWIREESLRMHEKTSSGLLLVSRDKIKIHLSDSKANLIHRAHQSIISSESVIWSYEQFPLEKKTHTHCGLLWTLGWSLSGKHTHWVVLVFYYCCNKLPKPWSLKTTQIYVSSYLKSNIAIFILYFCSSSIWHGSRQAKIKIPTGQHIFFWRI